MEPFEHLVFVYGTLTDPNRARAVVSPGAEPPPAGRPGDADGERRPTGTRLSFVGQAALDGLHRVEGRYPTLAPGGSVGGRLLAVGDAGLGRLDRYEGVDRGLYVRVAIPLTGVDGTNDAPIPDRPDRPTDEDPRVWTYVGDPERLSVDDHVTWPGDGPFDRRVRRYVDDGPVAVEIPDDLDREVGE